MSEATSIQTDVSVVIVNWNTRDILHDCLCSIHRETRDIDFEVIVVDNASSDDSAAMVRKEFPGVRLIVNDTNRGFAAANNQGMHVARGRYYLLLNSDTVMLDGAIQKTTAFADEHPEAGLVGCRVQRADGTLSQTAIMYPSLLNIALGLLRLDQYFPRHWFFDRERMGDWGYDTERDVPTLGGCFLFLRREALVDVGGFDEKYFMFAEEMDLCRRLKKGGWRLLFFPGAEIRHLHGASARLVPDRMQVQRRKSLLMFLTDSRGPVTAWVANLMYLAGTLVRLPFWMVWSIRRVEGYNRPVTLSAMWHVLKFHLKAVFSPRYTAPSKVADFRELKKGTVHAGVVE